MQNDVTRFLDSISYPSEREELKNIEIEKVLLHRKDGFFEVYLKGDVPLPYNAAKELLVCASNGIHGTEKCCVVFHYQAVLDSDISLYIEGLLKDLIIKKPSLSSVLEVPVIVNDDIITINCFNKMILNELKKETKELQKSMLMYGLKEVEFNLVLNEEMMASIKEEIKSAKEEVKKIEEPKKVVGDIILGKEITGEVSAIASTTGEQKGVVFEAYIFGIDTLERDNINIITLKISDKTNSIIAKIFKKDKAEYKAV